MLSNLFYMTLQCFMIYLVDHRLWWLPLIYWFILLPWAENYQKRHN